jgi:hypothetical protein
MALARGMSSRGRRTSREPDPAKSQPEPWDDVKTLEGIDSKGR